MAEIKIGQMWQKNSLGLLDKENWIDYGWIKSVGKNIYLVNNPSKGNVLKPQDLVKYYKKIKDPVYKLINVIEIDNKLFAIMAINYQESVEIVDANTTSN